MLKTTLTIVRLLGHLLDPGGLLVMPDTSGAVTVGWQSKPGLWYLHRTGSSVEAAVDALDAAAAAASDVLEAATSGLTMDRWAAVNEARRAA